MRSEVSFFWDNRFLKYDFGSGHPMKPVRLRLTYDLMRIMSLLDSRQVRMEAPVPATTEVLNQFHSDAYLDEVREVSKAGYGLLDAGDTSGFRECYEVSALIAGASVGGAEEIMRGEVEHAFNIAGGLHHAHPDRASGFCIFNDPAITIAYLKNRRGLKRVMYLDIDAHHGDGVMYGFYQDGEVLDIDFHEDGRYLFPGTGFAHETGVGAGRGLKINVPLLPGTGDEAYLGAFRSIVPKSVREYRPEFIIVQTGADSHYNDRLAHLCVTARTYYEIADEIHRLAHEVCGGRLLITGGGGYRFHNVARCWSACLAAVLGISIPEHVPVEWREIYLKDTGEETPSVMIEENVEVSGAASEELAKTLRDLKERIPLLS